MATNTLVMTASMAPRSQPLRGDMAVSFDFVPPDNWVQWFHTEDAGYFVFSSNSANFRRFGGAAPGATLTVGGMADLFYKVQYDKTKNQFKVTATNQVGTGTGGSGGTQGPAGEAATIQIGTVTSGPSPQVTNSGTVNDAIFNFVLQQGPQGPAGPAGADGAGVPPGGNLGDVLTVTSTGVYSWAPPSGSTGGTGGPDLTEKTITLNANKHIILAKSTGYNFYILLTEDAVQFPDPTGYLDGEVITLVVQQDATGGRKIQKYGTNMMFYDAQPLTLATQPNAMNEIRLKKTKGKWMVAQTPDKSVTAGYGLITAIGRIGTTDYYSMGEAYAASVTNDLVRILRSGKGSESIGTIGSDANGNPKILTVAGVAQADGSRPNLLVYPDTRLAFQKGIVNVEAGTVLLRDFMLNGARNVDATSRGIALNNASVTMRNLYVTNCENGTLWGEITQDQLIEDCWFDANGQAGLASAQGYTHNIYAGSGSGTVTVRRSSFTNCRYGHDFKTRMARTIIERCLMTGADQARELDCPNGGYMEVSDTRFHKLSSATQNNLVSIGQEGIQAGRARGYIFRNCEFRVDIAEAGRDVTFVWNADPDYDVILIDCTFVGAVGLANNSDGGSGLATVGGLRGRCVKQFTSGVTPGPRYAVGYQAQVIGVNGTN